MINTISRRAYRTTARVKRKNKQAFLRLCVRRSCQHIECQVIDDTSGVTKLHVSTNCAEFKKSHKAGNNKRGAEWIAKRLGPQLTKLKVAQLILERGKHRYQEGGCLEIIARAVSEAGVKI